MKNRNMLLHCEVHQSSPGPKQIQRQILFAAWPHVFSTRCTASFLEWALYGIYFVYRRDEDEANTTSTSCAAGAGRCLEMHIRKSHKIRWACIFCWFYSVAFVSATKRFLTLPVPVRSLSLSLSDLVLCNLDSRTAGPIFHWSFMLAFDVYKYGWMTWLHGCLKMLTRWIRRGTIWLVDPSLVWILLCIPRLFSTCAQRVLDDVPTDLMIHCTIPIANQIISTKYQILLQQIAQQQANLANSTSANKSGPGCFFQISRSAGSS